MTQHRPEAPAVSTSLTEAIDCALEQWSRALASGELSPSTMAVYSRLLINFGRFAAAHGTWAVSDVGPSLCNDWIHAPHRRPTAQSSLALDQPVAAATSRLRQSALRGAATTWLSRGLIASAPVPPLVFTRSAPGLPQPLTPSEARKLRAQGRLGTGDTFHPAVVAAALSGASQSELSRLVLADLNLETRSLHVISTDRQTARFVPLGPQGLEAMTHRLRDAAKTAKSGHDKLQSDSYPLVLRRSLASYAPNAIAPAVGNTIARAIRTAGLDRPGIRPGSLRDYAANQLYARTQRVEDVARLLGLASLDRTARLIDPVWQSCWGEDARQDEG